MTFLNMFNLKLSCGCWPCEVVGEGEHFPALRSDAGEGLAIAAACTTTRAQMLRSGPLGLMQALHAALPWKPVLLARAFAMSATRADPYSAPTSRSRWLAVNVMPGPPLALLLHDRHAIHPFLDKRAERQDHHG